MRRFAVATGLAGLFGAGYWALQVPQDLQVPPPRSTPPPVVLDVKAPEESARAVEWKAPPVKNTATQAPIPPLEPMPKLESAQPPSVETGRLIAAPKNSDVPGSPSSPQVVPLSIKPIIEQGPARVVRQGAPSPAGPAVPQRSTAVTTAARPVGKTGTQAKASPAKIEPPKTAPVKVAITAPRPAAAKTMAFRSPPAYGPAATRGGTISKGAPRLASISALVAPAPRAAPAPRQGPAPRAM
jgi:hypothetical protein